MDIKLTNFWPDLADAKKANEIRRFGKALRKLRQQGTSIDDFKRLIDPLMNGVRSWGMGYTSDKQTLYRSRLNESSRLFRNRSELTYPAPEFVRHKGRLNDIEESILYASSSELGTVVESIREQHHVGKLFTISRIEPSSHEPLVYMPMGCNGVTLGFRSRSQSEQALKELLLRELNEPGLDGDGYNFTIALARCAFKSHILSGKNKIDLGILFESAQGKKTSNATTYNVALKPDVFDRHYCFADTTVYALIQQPEHYLLTPLNKGSFDANGEIAWVHSYDEMVQRIRVGLDLDGRVIEEVRELEL